MDLELPNDCPEYLVETFETLIKVRTSIYNLIVNKLVEGECRYLHDDMYGYPYDYELYSKDSLDPQVQVLNDLLEKVEKTFYELKVLNDLK